MIEAMFKDIAAGRVRCADSPCNNEAMHEVNGTYEHSGPNVLAFRPLNMAWLKANILHFFSETEEAAPLLRINPHASRFLTGTRFVGAYGPQFLPQLRLCAEELLKDKDTRRAVATAGHTGTSDVNRPACINLMHFLHNDALDMRVYQRSCHLWGVLPYDLALLTNILHWMSCKAALRPGKLIWTFGSLHCNSADLRRQRSDSKHELYMDPELLDDPKRCWEALNVLAS